MQFLVIAVAPGQPDDVLSRQVADWDAAKAACWAELVNNCSKKWRNDVWSEWNSHDGSTNVTVTRKDGQSTVTYSFLR